MAKKKYKMRMKIKKGGESNVQENMDNSVKIANLAQKERASQVKEELSDSKIANENLTWWRKFFDTITKPFRIVGNLIVRFVVWLVDKIGIIINRLIQIIGNILSVVVDSKYPISHYIALALGILIVLLIINYFINGGSFGNIRFNSYNRNNDKKEQNAFEKFFNFITYPFRYILTLIYNFTKWFLIFIYDLLIPQFIRDLFSNIKSIFTPSYKTKIMFAGTNNEKMNEIPRDEINGRCDNMEYYQLSSNDNGLCTKTTKPKDLQWNINTNINKELSSSIPTNIVSKLSNEGKKFIVKIPWKQSGMEYVPDCDNMKYIDGTKVNLFTDNGKTCKMIIDEQQEYSEVGRYASNSDKYKGLDEFIIENNPICN